MRILLIDNHTRYATELQSLLSGHDVETVPFDMLSGVQEHDAIILSGGHKLTVADHKAEYAAELRMIRESDVPVLGICLGFELICTAYGEQLVRHDALEKGIVEIRQDFDDPIFAGIPSRFEAFENHRWGVEKVEHLLALASSKDGVEIVRSIDTRVYGLQFHPEMFPEKEIGRMFLKNFLGQATVSRERC